MRSDPLNIDSLFLLMNRLVRNVSLLNLSPDLRILVSINLRSGQLRRQLIPANDDWRVGLEEAINVFESPVGGFGVEEVGDRDERKANTGLIIVVLLVRGVKCGGWVIGISYPDDPELVA